MKPRQTRLRPRFRCLSLAQPLAARAAALAGIDPDLIPFTAVLSMVRTHVTADAC